MYGISTWNRSEKTRMLEERDRDGQSGRRGRLRDRSNKISNRIIIKILIIHLDNKKMYQISYLFIECKDSWNNCYPSDCKFSSRYCQKTCGLCGKLATFLNQKHFSNFCVLTHHLLVYILPSYRNRLILGNRSQPCVGLCQYYRSRGLPNPHQ